jgi:c-di-GMP-binding flagellar brake protein YcgR
MSAPSPTDKRIAPRIPVRIHIRFRLLSSPGGEPPESELHNGNNLMSNVSRTGFFLSTKNYLDIKSQIEVEFPLEPFKQLVRAEAEVVRANHANFPNQGRYEYGLHFLSMHPQVREMLDKFLKMAES